MSELTCKKLADMVIVYRENHNGKYPESGFVSHDDFQRLLSDRNIHKYSRLDLGNYRCDFDFMGVPFFICNHNNTPLTLV